MERLKFQMAWTSKEEEAMSIVCQYMGVMKEEKKRELSEIYSQLIFPKKENEWSMEIGIAWDNVK